MYVSRLFVWDQDHESGLTGWRMTRPAPHRIAGYEVIPGLIPTDDFGLLHDALDHFTPPTDDDHLENEFMALGQTAFIRIEVGMLNRMGRSIPPAAYDIGGVLSNVLRDNTFSENRYVAPACPFTHQRNEFMDAFVEKVIEHTTTFLKSEMRDNDDSTDLEEALGMLPDMGKWLHHGYAMARRRWMRRPVASYSDVFEIQCSAAEMFWDAVETYNRSNFRYGEQGDALRIGFNLRRFEYTFTPCKASEW